MIKWIYSAVFCLVGLCCFGQPVFAQSLLSIDTESVIVCESTSEQSTQPLFTESFCQKQQLFEVDPQNKEIWLKANLLVTQVYLQRKQPSALFIFAKMSREVYFNRELIGNSGTPSFLAKHEFVGDMDTRFYIPPRLIKQGDNEVVIHISSHHGVLTLARPIHFIGLAEYAQTSDFFKRDLFISLCLLGALLLGCVYLAAIALRSEHKKSTLLILLMMLFSSTQLFVEISRVLFNYSYPLHDVRLISVTTLALGFGFSFIAFSVDKFVIAHQRKLLLISMLLTTLLVIFTTSFDNKTAVAVLIPALISLILSAVKYKSNRTKEFLGYLIVYAIFTSTIIFTFSTFHSMYFYYIVTSMMAFLVIRKATELMHEKSLRKSEEQQVLKLQLTLDQIQQQNTPTKLKIASAGKIDFLPTQNIAYCKAAGDYVEIFMTNKHMSLFSGTLKVIEEQLPATFIKVHRSFIVNLEQVVSIISNKQGPNSGALLMLQTGTEIPVSRRILPKVREVVNGNAEFVKQ